MTKSKTKAQINNTKKQFISLTEHNEKFHITNYTARTLAGNNTSINSLIFKPKKQIIEEQIAKDIKFQLMNNNK